MEALKAKTEAINREREAQILADKTALSETTEADLTYAANTTTGTALSSGSGNKSGGALKKTRRETQANRQREEGEKCACWIILLQNIAYFRSD